MEEQLIQLLSIIAKKAEERFTLLSEYPESKELTKYALQKYGHWNGIIEGDEIHLGRLYNRLMDYKLFNNNNLSDHVDVPFHCYEITPGDVVFITYDLEWDPATKQYTGPMAEVIRQMSININKPQYLTVKKTKQKPQQKGLSKEAKKGILIVLLSMLSFPLLYLIMYIFK